MEDVTLAQAKATLEDLMARATRGEDVCISDARLGTVKLIAINRMGSGKDADVRIRRPGRWNGKFTVPARLFEPLNDEELAWLSGERGS